MLDLVCILFARNRNCCYNSYSIFIFTGAKFDTFLMTLKPGATQVFQNKNKIQCTVKKM